jgi:hypothetical protein
MLKKIIEFWNKMPREWQFGLSGFVFARTAITLWSFVLSSLFPVSFQNLDLNGELLVTAIRLSTSERYVYSRRIGDTPLTFRLVDSNHMVDDRTGSIWTLDSGRAVQGEYAGVQLSPSSYTAEDLFAYLGVEPSRYTSLAIWQRFDTNWYLKIATRGYDRSDGSTAFFPIYPLLIRVLSFLTDPLLAAMLISNLALLGALVLLHRLISDLVDIPTAQRALIYLLAFPTAFFLMAGYTESLFLFSASACFYSASKRRWVWSAIWGSLAALTRLQGVLLIIPLAYMLWRETRFQPLKNFIWNGLPLMIIPVVSLAFLGYTKLSLFNTLQDRWSSRFVFPWETLMAAISMVLNGKGTVIDVINLVMTLGLIASLVAVWKKLPFEYTLYTALMLIVPLFRMINEQPLVSITRYALAAFPIFIVFGMWGRNMWVNRAILYSFVPLQLYLSAQFFLWGWVA